MSHGTVKGFSDSASFSTIALSETNERET